MLLSELLLNCIVVLSLIDFELVQIVLSLLLLPHIRLLIELMVKHIIMLLH